MVATLRERNNTWYCSNCLMRQNTLRHACSFCSAEFANYMEVLYSNWKTQEDEKNHFEEEQEKDEN